MGESRVFLPLRILESIARVGCGLSWEAFDCDGDMLSIMAMAMASEPFGSTIPIVPWLASCKVVFGVPLLR